MGKSDVMGRHGSAHSLATYISNYSGLLRICHELQISKESHGSFRQRFGSVYCRFIHERTENEEEEREEVEELEKEEKGRRKWKNMKRKNEVQCWVEGERSFFWQEQGLCVHQRRLSLLEIHKKVNI